MLAAHDHKLSFINISADAVASKLSQQSFTVTASQESGQTWSRADHALETENSWGKGAKITSMVYSEADRRVYTGGYNKKITVWNVNLENFS